MKCTLHNKDMEVGSDLGPDMQVRKHPHPPLPASIQNQTTSSAPPPSLIPILFCCFFLKGLPCSRNPEPTTAAAPPGQYPQLPVMPNPLHHCNTLSIGRLVSEFVFLPFWVRERINHSTVCRLQLVGDWKRIRLLLLYFSCCQKFNEKTKNQQCVHLSLGVSVFHLFVFVYNNGNHKYRFLIVQALLWLCMLMEWLYSVMVCKWIP